MRMRSRTLSHALRSLSDELRRAIKEAKDDGQEDVITLKEASLELALIWEANGEAGIEWSVLKLGGRITRTSAHTVTLTLAPIGRPVVGFGR